MILFFFSFFNCLTCFWSPSRGLYQKMFEHFYKSELHQYWVYKTLEIYFDILYFNILLNNSVFVNVCWWREVKSSWCYFLSVFFYRDQMTCGTLTDTISWSHLASQFMAVLTGIKSFHSFYVLIWGESFFYRIKEQH